MRYIGPFFRMNSLSQKEISNQLFYLSKESVKTIVLNSKCGLLIPIRISKKSSSTNDISILNNFSPLMCIYKKSSPMFIHNKTSRGFDESTLKKEINPSTNALMTLCLLELSDYYSNYDKDNRNIISFEKPFKYLAKQQLKFYSENLRNNEGVFVNKKNISDGNSKGFNLIDKNNKFKFSDQAFMMAAYYLYSFYNKSDADSNDYERFSNEILYVLNDYKESLYDLSFEDDLNILLCLNIHYKYSHNPIAYELILDLSDFLINKFMTKDYYSNSLENCCLLAICLMESYKHTNIISFKEINKEINDKLLSLYDNEKNIFIKLTDKKETKYSCVEINLYLLSLMVYAKEEDKISELKPIISNIYRKFYINNDLLTSWPEAPTLDEVERYKKLSLKSDDMLDETYFRMPNLPSPESTGLAPIFVKYLNYSRKKDCFTVRKVYFDSNKNMFSFLLFIYFLKEDVQKEMGFNKENNSLDLDTCRTTSDINDNVDNNNVSSDDINNSNQINNANIINDADNTKSEIASINNNNKQLNSSNDKQSSKEIIIAKKSTNDINKTLNSSDNKSKKSIRDKSSNKKI
ncbi:hypothetical protein [Clostridium taeniosporum]|uniref:Uncharacterized protein n=1 Tax=Clostridium taeniosporum TaxID=394958 RepID=A0A1D7XGR2_9CLOT|nr:hypothetical protein [Clostridium taeniosporum]AOR22551.1 hypothetical protein BGI42_01855 [Clostridium taeniosporum]